MSTDLLPATIPSYALTTQADRAMNADALVGISTGFPPSIRIKASKFRIVDGNGGETVLRTAELAQGEYLPVVILAARRGLNKVYYASAYDPNQAEASAPDCFSMDGEKPDASIKAPQCTSCAACPMNAFGSGRNQANQPTKGKACSDNKILAVLYKGGVYQFKVPPASLKNWGMFVKKLDSHEVSIGAVITYVGFDENADYSVLTFHAADFLKPEQIAAVGKYRTSAEVREITSTTYTPTAAPVVETPAPTVAPVKEEPIAPVIDIFGGAPAETAAPAAGKKTRAKKDAAEPAIEEATLSDADIIAGLNL